MSSTKPDPKKLPDKSDRKSLKTHRRETITSLAVTRERQWPVHARAHPSTTRETHHMTEDKDKQIRDLQREVISLQEEVSSLRKQIRELTQNLTVTSRNLDTVVNEKREVEDSLERRKLVERAKGVVMRRYKWTEETAYRNMQRIAMNRRMQLVELARMILNGERIREFTGQQPHGGDGH